MGENRIRVRYLRPDEITVPEVRVTSMWSEEEYEAFQTTVEVEGIQEPLKCIKEGETWWLVDGLHRLDEAKRLNLLKIPVAYTEGTIQDALLKNLYMNRMRGKTPASDEVRLIKHLIDKFGLTLTQISEKTGLPPSRIDMLLKIGGAAPEVLSCLEFEQIPLGTAYQLSRLPNQQGQIALLSRLMQATPPATVREVTEIINMALEIQEEMKEAKPPPPLGPPIRTISCFFCGERYEAKEMRGVNSCPTCLGLARDFIQRRKKMGPRPETPAEALALKVARGEVTEADLEAIRARTKPPEGPT